MGTTRCTELWRYIVRKDKAKHAPGNLDAFSPSSRHATPSYPVISAGNKVVFCLPVPSSFLSSSYPAQRSAKWCVGWMYSWPTLCCCRHKNSFTDGKATQESRSDRRDRRLSRHVPLLQVGRAAERVGVNVSLHCYEALWGERKGHDSAKNWNHAEEDLVGLMGRTVAELKSQLLRALSAPSLQRAVFEPKLPHLADPISDDDFQIYEDLADTDAEQDVIGYRTIEGDRKDMGKSVRQLGFKRWKTLYIRYADLP